MLNLVTRLYAILLRSYPRQFRDEFDDEMRTVFLNALTEATQRGRLALMDVCWRQVRDLPGMLGRAHALDHRETEMNPEANFRLDEEQPSWRAIIVGLFPFALGTISLLTSYPFPPPAWKSSIEWQLLTAAAYLVPVFVILVIGWMARFPRWSYPYVGFASFVLTIVWAEPIRRILMLRTAEVQVLAIGIMLFLLFGCLVLFGSIWRPLRPLYEGIRRDWTQFSFGLYVVAALFASVVDHDDYTTLTATVMMPSLILLLGALAYLCSPKKPQRILSMLIALSLSAGVRVIEHKEFYPAMIVIIGIIAFLPALFEFLPRAEKSPRAV